MYDKKIVIDKHLYDLLMEDVTKVYGNTFPYNLRYAYLGMYIRSLGLIHKLTMEVEDTYGYVIGPDDKMNWFILKYV